MSKKLIAIIILIIILISGFLITTYLYTQGKEKFEETTMYSFYVWIPLNKDLVWGQLIWHL
jgi:flagellar basal body-associated protein FliL